MATEEQKKKMWDLANASQSILLKQCDLLRTLTPDAAEANPSLVGEVLDQVDALKVDFEVARQELNDYRNSVLSGTAEE